MPLLFASSALSCGIGAVLFMLPVVGERAIDIRSAEILGVILLVVNVVFLGVYVLNVRSAMVAAKESVRTLLSGRLAVPFLMGVSGVGLIVSLIVTLFAYLVQTGFGAASPVLALVGLLVLFGGYLFRHCILKAGVYAPII